MGWVTSGRFLGGGPGLWLWLVLLTLPLAASAQGPPPAGRCPDQTGASGEAPLEDAGTPLFKEGAKLGLEDVLALERLLPEEIWTYREAFLASAPPPGSLSPMSPCLLVYSKVPMVIVQYPGRFREELIEITCTVVTKHRVRQLGLWMR